MKNYFEGRCREGVYQNRDCLYIKTATGEKVVLISGGGKAGDEKLIKGNTYGTAYITEANECSKTFIQEVFDRTLSSPDRKIFHDLNPKAEAHWYYQDVLNFHEEKLKANPKYGLNYGHFTIADNMSISDDQLRAVLSTYDRKSVWYARDILGLRKMAEGLVYPMFSREKHVVKGEIPYSSRHRYYVSIDYGTVNPFAAGLWDYDPVSHKAIMIRELYYRGGSTNRTDNEGYYRMLKRLIGDIKIEYIIIDPSASSMVETIEKYAEYLVVRADNDVLNGIQDVTKFLNLGLLLFHESCKETFKEFDQYSWDEESGEDAVIKELDHSMDMIRYFCRTALRSELKYIV